MIRAVALSFLLLACTPALAVRIAPKSFTAGFAPGILVSGLRPHEAVRIHAVAAFGKWVPDGKGGWVEKTEPYRAWADVRADRRGEVAMDRFQVGTGTYVGVDGYGLLWSMRPAGDPSLTAPLPKTLRPLPIGVTRILIARGLETLAEADLPMAEPPGLTIETVARGALNGVFAAPADGRKRPVVILLHGSEGGGARSARALAVRYAGQGYAAFALNYFAWDLEKLRGVPNIHINQPIELLEQVRAWLATRPEADVGRIGVYGHSKGAEYAEVAAVRYRWIKAVAACVPTDVVWEGYGIGDGRNAPDPAYVPPRLKSSWSWRGVPLPYVPLKPWAKDAFFDNSERYELSRQAHLTEAAKAAIPIERSGARVLLIGGGRDEVWASGAMATRLAARMRRAGKAARVDLVVYPAAGHQICGDGTYPTHVWASASSDPRVKDPVAEGKAAADAWVRIKAFFARAL
jgi:dienelactone hydrolase